MANMTTQEILQGIKDWAAPKVIYDISAAHNNTKYTDLSDALGTNGGNIPQEYREGGITVRFVRIYDNKYVQYRFMLSEFTAAQFTNTANWQGVDDEPIVGSDNLVRSGGIVKYSNKILNVLRRTDDLEYKSCNFTLDSSQGVYVLKNSYYRISSFINILNYHGIAFNVSDGYKVIFITLNHRLDSLQVGDTFNMDDVRISPWYSESGTFELEGDESCVVCTIGKTDESRIETSEGENMSFEAITTEKYIHLLEGQLNSEISKKAEGGYFLSIPVATAIPGSAVPNRLWQYIPFDVLFVEIATNQNPNYEVSWGTLNSDKTTLIRTSNGWSSNGYMVYGEDNENEVFLRVSVRRLDDGDITQEDIDYVNANYITKLIVGYSTPHTEVAINDLKNLVPFYFDTKQHINQLDGANNKLEFKLNHLFSSYTAEAYSFIKANLVNGRVANSNVRCSALLNVTGLDDIEIEVSDGFKVMLILLNSESIISELHIGDDMTEKIVSIGSWFLTAKTEHFALRQVTDVIITVGKVGDATISVDEAKTAFTIKAFPHLYYGRSLSNIQYYDNAFVSVQNGARAWFDKTDIPVFESFIVTTNKNESYQVSCGLFVDDDMVDTVSWVDNILYTNTNTEINRVRFSVKRSDGQNMTADEIAYINSTYITAIKFVLLEYSETNQMPISSETFADRAERLQENIRLLSEEIFGTGNQLYYGKKINLNIKQEYSCNLVTLKEFDFDENYVYTSVESAAIYGEYLFLATCHLNTGSNGDLIVIDMDTLLPVGKISYGANSYDNHGNNIQFSNVFYNVSDEFPLCIISYFGTNPNNVKGEAMIVRITKDSNNVFSGEIISHIKTAENKPYMTWGFDLQTHRIIAYGFNIDSYSVHSEYMVSFYQWEMPSDLTSDVTLSLDDAIKNTIPHTLIPQGFFAKNGKIYFYNTSEGAYPKGDVVVGMWVIDEVSFETESIIPVPRIRFEPEGITEYKGSLILVDRVPGAQSGKVLRINKVNF